MDESALQNRLDRIETQVTAIRSLLVVGYVFAGTWFLVEEVAAVTVWNAGIGLIALTLVLSAVGMYRRRQAGH